MTATTSSRSLLWARVFILLFGASLLVTYAQLVKFIPDGITGGLLDGARNIAQGRGLVTNSINPAFLPYYKDLTLPLPYLWYPLVPFVTAGFFIVLGSHPWCLLIFPVAAYFLSALLLLELGRRLFGIGTGLLAAVLLLSHPFMIETSMRENFTDPVLIFLLIACVLAVFIAGGDAAGRPMAWLVLAGVTLGLAQYARSAATTLYVPMAFLIVSSFDEKRGVRLAVFLGSCLAIQVPMFLWNLKHVGTLTFTPAYVFLFLTRSFPGLSAFSYLLPTRVHEVTRLYGRDILEKWLSQVWVHYKYFFTAANPIVLVGAALTMTSTLTRPQRVLRNFTAVLYVSLVAVDSLIYWDNRYLLPVIPFVALLGFEFLRRLLSTAPLSRVAKALTVGAIAAFVSIEGIDFFYQSSKAKALELATVQVNLERTRFIIENVRPTDVVLVADPGLVAWETGNTSVGMPKDLETATTIHSRYVKFNTMILDERRPRADLFSYSEDWYRVAAGDKRFLGFQREKWVTLSSGQTMVLLRDAGSR